MLAGRDARGGNPQDVKRAAAKGVRRAGHPSAMPNGPDALMAARDKRAHGPTPDHGPEHAQLVQMLAEMSPAAAKAAVTALLREADALRGTAR